MELLMEIVTSNKQNSFKLSKKYLFERKIIIHRQLKPVIRYIIKKKI
jgi:hypothetical protein